MYLELILSSDVVYFCPNLLSEVFLLKLPGDVYGWNYGMDHAESQKGTVTSL